MENIISAFYELKKQGIGKETLVLKIVGDGPLKAKIMRMTNDLNLDNIYFYKSVSEEELASKCKNCDGFIFAVLDLPKFIDMELVLIKFLIIWHYLNQ